MKRLFISLGIGFLFASGLIASADERPSTFCNPLDLNYRFQMKESHREAADPTVVRFQDEYWLFASKSGGYWHSKDFAHWVFVAPTGLPLEAYAPTVEVIGGKLYFTAGGTKNLFTTDDPAIGKWTKVTDFGRYDDPALFADDDGHVYMYQGTSDKKPITGVELDPAHHFTEIGAPVDLISADPVHHGWELKKPLESDDEIQKRQGLPYLEGSWMNKHNGHYYLQYAAPGTEKIFYADGVYVSDHPLGPFQYEPYNPFAYKPGGFIGGTGHGSTFKDGGGNYWHADCMLIGVRAGFERRLGIFPAGFVANGSQPDQMVCNTTLGDYPQFVPGGSTEPLKNNSPGWMLLSYKKTATASSSEGAHTPEKAFDEDIRTWWSAATGNAGEWLNVDLGKPCQIQAVQINFADEGATALAGTPRDAYQFVVETSDDGKTWTTCISRKDNTRDAPHEYVQLDAPVMARYVKLTNFHTPYEAKFSVSGLRLFGSGLGQAPAQVTGISAQLTADPRVATVNWSPVAGADFYIVRYGIAADRLFLSYPVYDQTHLDLFGLNVGTNYYITVDAVNDSGVTVGPVAIPVAAAVASKP